MGVSEVLRENNLCNVVAAGAKLVQDLALGEELQLLDVIQRTRGVDEVSHAFPIGLPSRNGRSAGALNGGHRCGHARLSKNGELEHSVCPRFRNWLALIARFMLI